MSLKITDPKATPFVDPWDTPEETWQFVTIPDEDFLGKRFPSISLNKFTLQAGQTSKVPAQIAAYFNDRIKVFNKSCVRLLQPNADLKSINEVATGTSAPSAPGGHRPMFVDATQIHTL